MRRLLSFFITWFFISTASSQTVFKRNSAYAEFMGTGLVLSANYERQLSQKPGFGVHIGVGLGGYKPAIPLGVKYILDLGNEKSFAEAGLGITLAEMELWDSDYNHPSDKNPYKPGFIPSIGYRHHSKSGFMWRTNYTPLFSKWKNAPWLFGVSVGWRF